MSEDHVRATLSHVKEFHAVHRKYTSPLTLCCSLELDEKCTTEGRAKQAPATLHATVDKTSNKFVLEIDIYAILSETIYRDCRIFLEQQTECTFYEALPVFRSRVLHENVLRAKVYRIIYHNTTHV
ncbi:hypothetical protein PUN28_007048 [Cardiocondyla obscurior]|uniref:Uncharacterized protein n=1 Tax=Cardiocondyla obscurior TaxID=286306 RepID=A0AAW2G7F4_9HYME